VCVCVCVIVGWLTYAEVMGTVLTAHTFLVYFTFLILFMFVTAERGHLLTHIPTVCQQFPPLPNTYMSWGDSVSGVIRLRPEWPRIRSSILSKNNRSLFPKEPPAQFLPRALSPAINRPAKDAGHLHLLLRFRISGDMPPPPHTLSWSIQGTQFHWYFRISATIFTLPSVLLPVRKARRTNSFVDPFFGRFLPHFFRFIQQFGCQPSTSSWRKAKRLQNLVSCSTQPHAKRTQFREPQGLSFWSLWFISRRCRDLTSQNVDARINGERWTGN